MHTMRKWREGGAEWGDGIDWLNEVAEGEVEKK